MLDMATEHGLTLIGADPIKMWISLYADDNMPFLRPIASDVTNLQYLLNQFGMATELCTNIQKSEIFPIRCEGLNIPEILGEFQVQQGSFPCKYLRLPLRIGSVTPWFWETKLKLPYVCQGCFNHMYNEQYGEQIQYLDKLQVQIFTKVTRGSERRLQLGSDGNLSIGATSIGTTGGEAHLVFFFWLVLVLLIILPTFGSI
jgi:hypothetical protein